MAQKAISFEVDFKTESDMPPRSGMTKTPGKSLVRALRSKYCADHEGQKFGHITIIQQGRQRKKSSSEDAAELEYLTNVCLSNNSIRRSGLEEQNLTALCPNVVDLDISGNKLDSWSEILPVIQQLNGLKFLNMARNLITKDKDALFGWTGTLPGLENLVLNETGAQWQEILHLSKLLPCLRELHICGNNFREIPAGRHDGLHSVECLRMNDNHITKWEQVWKLHHLPRLTSLILSGNPLMDIFYHDDKPECTCTCHGSLLSNGIHDNSNIDEVEVRQYCENILNAVLDDIIRRDVVGENERWINMGENSSIEENDQNKLSEEAGFQSNGNENESTTVINADTKPVDIEQLSREVVESVLQRAIDIVSGEIEVEPNVDNSREAAKSADRKDGRKYSRNQISENQNISMQNCENAGSGLGDSTEELFKGQNFCCPCEEIYCDTPFNSLETLCVSETHIGKWKHLSALRGFPALRAVRIKNVKLGSKLSDEDRRKLFMASLPNIKFLNGSEVSPAEREKSERHLLRHFCDKKQKPDIYHVLEQKHGQLTPLVDIDISKGYTDYATLTFVYHGKVAFTETVCVRDAVGTLRKLVWSKLNKSKFRSVTLYHKHCNDRHEETMGELEEMRCESLPMSRLDILDGDEIHIDDTQGQNNYVKYYVN